MSFVPLAILLAAVAVDLAAFFHRRRAADPAWWTGWIGWIARPFSAWAILNLVYRFGRGSLRVNPLTYPVYANLRAERPDDDVWVWLRLAVTVALIAASILGVRVALRRPGLGALATLWLLLSATQLSIALVPEGWSGIVRPWTAPNLVYAWSARRVKEPSFFLWSFPDIHRRLDLHARSHPPGATLLAYWTQNHSRPATRANPARSVALASLNVLFVGALGWSLFGRRTGVVAAAIAGSTPTATTLMTFSQDAVYAVFFSAYLLLSWQLARGRPLVAWGVAAGLLLFVLSMLTFSWSIAAAGATLYVLVAGCRERMPSATLAVRTGLPFLIAVAGHAALRLVTGFDYLDSFRRSYAFHVQFYPFETAWQWILALAGSQLEILLGLGPLAAAATAAALSGRALRRRAEAPYAFVWCVLFAYSLPFLFGPNPLKFEAARSWYWITAILAVVAADRLVAAAPGDDRPLLLAPAASMVTTLLLLWVLDFGV